MPPTASGNQPRICATKLKPVCCVATGRSMEYSTLSTMNDSGPKRSLVWNGPESSLAGTSNGVPSNWSRMNSFMSCALILRSGFIHSGMRSRLSPTT